MMTGFQMMDDLPHEASGQSGPTEPPELPDGWRYASTTEWDDPYRAARRRKRALKMVPVVLALACMVGLALWNAATHYARGVHALQAHEYSWAVDEFSASRVFGIPYRNAQSLERQAQRSAAADDTRLKQIEARQATVIAQLKKAGAELKAGDASAVLTALRGISAADLQADLDGDDTVRASVHALAGDLADAARAALRSGAWSRAGRFTAAILVLQPSSKLAVSLETQAKSGQELSVKLVTAKAAAQHGKWRKALQLALAVVAAQKDFPGAVALVAEARSALAPKPPARTTTTPTQAAAPPATGPASQPAPP
jgi:hypothetical protein